MTNNVLQHRHFDLRQTINFVERAGLRSLNEGQTIEYEIESNRGRESAANLRVR
jgi:cold shock CspA family protein